MKAGINLYSLRTLISTEKEFLETAIKLRDMGYSYLQYSGAEFVPERIKKVSLESGLPVCLTHVPQARIIGDTERLMEDHEVFGCKNIGLGSISQADIVDEYKLKKSIEQLNAAAELMHKNGFSFYCHHHHYEFYRHRSETVFDYILKNAPYINFTFDTYWVQYGGANILNFLDKFDGRIGCVHLKDYKIGQSTTVTDKVSLVPRFASVGSGLLDMKAIVDKMRSLNTKYYFVEQDDACTAYADPLAEVENSIKYITKEL